MMVSRPCRSRRSNPSSHAMVATTLHGLASPSAAAACEASFNFVHLGVLRAFEEAGIRADVVAGTSVGALAATLYAS